jgi:endo-1,4-beta-mannosidase
LREVVGALRDHPGIYCWNLGNEPDLFAWPPDAASGRAWAREMTNLIGEIDPRPVTTGLHSAELMSDVGLRIDQVFEQAEFGVMHIYPMYVAWVENPLDTDFVPFATALTAALGDKPVLMEEFGGCTAPPGQASQVWEWTSFGKPRKQFMASEEDLAEYLRVSLPKLVEVGALGAMVWCFADYHPDLWNRPPCDESIHERHFGLIRPDGSLKPHAQVIKQFASTHPTVRPIPPWAQFDIDPDAYYRRPMSTIAHLWKKYRSRRR